LLSFLLTPQFFLIISDKHKKKSYFWLFTVYLAQINLKPFFLNQKPTYLFR
jgi:hypothetical protein